MEAMALESLVASSWRLEGFLTVVRHAVRVKGGYSDVDVVGVRGDGTVRVAECKARGPARAVYVDRGDGQGWSSWRVHSAALANLSRLWQKDPPKWLPAAGDVRTLEFHLVGNVWFPDEDAHRKAEACLAAKVRARLPEPLREKGQGLVSSSADLLLGAINNLRKRIVDEEWGKRYGDPLLDAVRELIRYAHAQPREGGRGIGGAVPRSLRCRLLNALFGEQ